MFHAADRSPFRNPFDGQFAGAVADREQVEDEHAIGFARAIDRADGGLGLIDSGQRCGFHVVPIADHFANRWGVVDRQSAGAGTRTPRSGCASSPGEQQEAGQNDRRDGRAIAANREPVGVYRCAGAGPSCVVHSRTRSQSALEFMIRVPRVPSV